MDDSVQTPAVGTTEPQPVPTTTEPAAQPTDLPAQPATQDANATGAQPAPTADAQPKAGLLDAGGDDANTKPADKTEPKSDEANEGILGAPTEGYSQEGMQGADPEIAQAFMGAAKELNLSQESVDKLYGAVAPAMQKRAAALMDKAETEWRAKSLADSEFGGQDFQKNSVRMNQAFAKYASPELQKLFRESRLDCHPEVLRMFYRISQDISEDVLVKGNGGTGRTGRSNDPRDMYPNTKMNL